MHGPSTASTGSSMDVRTAATASASTPASRPRHPACTAPMRPFSLTNATGAQSPTQMSSTTSSTSVTNPSKTTPSQSPGRATTPMVVPCTSSGWLHGRSTKARRRPSSVARGCSMWKSPWPRWLQRMCTWAPARVMTWSGTDPAITSRTRARRDRRRRRASSPRRRRKDLSAARWASPRPAYWPQPCCRWHPNPIGRNRRRRR